MTRLQQVFTCDNDPQHTATVPDSAPAPAGWFVLAEGFVMPGPNTQLKKLKLHVCPLCLEQLPALLKRKG